MKKVILPAIAAGIILMAPFMAYAQRGGPGPCEGMNCDGMCGGKGPVFGDTARMKKELGLKDEQVKKIADINREFEKKMLDYREKLAPLNIRLKKMLLEDAVDMEKVRSLIREISDIRVDLQTLRVQHRLEIEKVLTPEQKSSMRQHRRHMMKKGRGRCPNP